MKSYYVIWQDKQRDKLEVLELPDSYNLIKTLQCINDEQGPILPPLFMVKSWR